MREIRPLPIAPMLMRLLGAFLPNTVFGTMEGNPRANEVKATAFADDSMNFLLEILELLLFSCANIYVIMGHMECPGMWPFYFGCFADGHFINQNLKFNMQLFFNGDVYLPVWQNNSRHLLLFPSQMSIENNKPIFKRVGLTGFQ